MNLGGSLPQTGRYRGVADGVLHLPGLRTLRWSRFSCCYGFVQNIVWDTGWCLVLYTYEYWFHNVQDLVSDQSGQLQWKVHERTGWNQNRLSYCCALTTCSCGVYTENPVAMPLHFAANRAPVRCAKSGGLAQWEQQTLAEVFRLRVGRSGAETNDQKPKSLITQCVNLCMYVN